MRLFKIFILALLLIGCKINEKKHFHEQKLDVNTLNAINYINQHDYIKAIKCLSLVLHNKLPGDTNSYFYYYKIGFCFEKQQHLDSAEIYYKKALRTALLKKIIFQMS